MTVNGLRNSRFLHSPPTSFSVSDRSPLPASASSSNLEPLLNQSDIIADPLTVLRCDERVFRSPPLLDITLHILNACLHVSTAEVVSSYMYVPGARRLKRIMVLIYLLFLFHFPMWKGQQNRSLLKLHTTKRERALGEPLSLRALYH